LSQLERSGADCPLPLVDLSRIDHEQRALTWDTAVRDAFPTLSVKLAESNPSLGTINRVSMGSGDLVEIDSAPVDVTHNAAVLHTSKNARLSLMVQSKGSMVVRQAGRSVLLRRGDLCLIDEGRSFRLIGEGCSKILFLRMSRAAALSRYPPLERLMVTPFPADEPGTRMLAETLLRFGEVASELSDMQRNAMMNAVIQLLGMAEPLCELAAAPDWRVRRALDYIELNLSMAGLTAEAVAKDQRISRRRLDQLMQDAFGHSIASHLWSRRLEQAAADLRDPHRSGQSIAQIAFANGFEDAAHFTRAFKRRFSVTPRQWRAN
jgi:AraC-like DNA-binding protein